MTDLWTAPRQHKGKTCWIILTTPHKANIFTANSEGAPTGAFAYTVFDPAFAGLEEADGWAIHTDPRYSYPTARLMGEGVMSGLEERRDHLPGRFVVCKAIGLAVHLGFSTIFLSGVEHVSPRAGRNLDTMRRPLKGARVRLVECNPGA